MMCYFSANNIFCAICMTSTRADLFTNIGDVIAHARGVSGQEHSQLAVHFWVSGRLQGEFFKVICSLISFDFLCSMENDVEIF